jgi:hypothetical protein
VARKNTTGALLLLTAVLVEAGALLVPGAELVAVAALLVVVVVLLLPHAAMATTESTVTPSPMILAPYLPIDYTSPSDAVDTSDVRVNQEATSLPNAGRLQVSPRLQRAHWLAIPRGGVPYHGLTNGPARIAKLPHLPFVQLTGMQPNERPADSNHTKRQFELGRFLAPEIWTRLLPYRNSGCRRISLFAAVRKGL